MDKPISRKNVLKGAAVGAVGAMAASLGLPVSAPDASTKPNFLVIMADDFPAHMKTRMNRLIDLITNKGVDFTKAYTAIPICGPNRASFFKGLYAHNHGCYLNDNTYLDFEDQKGDTLASRLKAAGYANGLFGKYLNGHEDYQPAQYPAAHWDRWCEQLKAGTVGDGGQYQVNIDGDTSWVSKSDVNENVWPVPRCEAFIRNHAASTDPPWFALYSTTAPHKPYDPTTLHADDYDTLPRRDVPSVNEELMGDKPSFMQGDDTIPNATLQDEQEGKAEENEDLDDGIEQLILALIDTGQLANTHIIFTADNGFMLGEHRQLGKDVPYEESSKIPLIWRGPGVHQGVDRNGLVSTIDITRTILGLAGANTAGLDGRHLGQILTGTATTVRQRLLVESPAGQMGWHMLREAPYSYTEYKNGEKELYDLGADQYQLQNSYPSASAVLTSDLAAKLAALKGCSAGGTTCQVADGG